MVNHKRDRSARGIFFYGNTMLLHIYALMEWSDGYSSRPTSQMKDYTYIYTYA